MANHKGTNSINTWHGAGHSQLGTAACLAGNALNLNCTVLHFWYFLAEEVFNKAFIATAQDQLRAPILALNILNKHLDALANTIELALDLLALG